MSVPVLGRITTEYLIEEDNVIRYIQSSPKAFMVLENPKTNRHFHFVVYVKSKNGNRRTAKDYYARQFKKQCESYFKMIDGKLFSRQIAFTECDQDLEKLKKYLCKGSNRNTPPIVVINNGFIFESEIPVLQQEYWTQNDEYKKQKPKTKYEKIIAYELPKTYINKELEMAMKISMYHIDNGLLIPDKYQLQKMVETYLIKQSPDPYKSTEWLMKTYLNLNVTDIKNPFDSDEEEEL